MIYGINDKPPIGKWILLSIQLMLSCFVATALIASICGVNMSGALIGAGLSTIIYLILTGFKSPMFISNSGAFVAPVLVALGLGGYSAVAVGGITAAIVYAVFGILLKLVSLDKIYVIFPKVLIGTITICIGVNLMAFIPTYVGDTGNIGVGIALFTMLIVILSSHYLKGVWSMFPFLIGTLAGYAAAIPFGLVDFSVFNNSLFCIPTFAFTQWKPIETAAIVSTVIIYIAYTISAMCECLADHKALSNIIEVDLYKEPGLSKIFFGEGAAQITASCLGGLGSCSYGESIATVGFSKCGSTFVTFGAAIILILLGFLSPVQQFIISIPKCVFAGSALILYGFIANSGIKTLQSVDFSNQKNLILCSAVMSIGISGIILGNDILKLSGTALAMIAGILLNIIIAETKKEKEEGKEKDAVIEAKRQNISL